MSMTHLNLTTIETIINASPKATLLIDAAGGVLCINDAARALLHLSRMPLTLPELFEAREALKSSLRDVLHNCKPLPLLVRRSDASKPLQMQIQPLINGGTGSASHLLVTLEAHSGDSEKLQRLEERLENETAERRRLLVQNSKLRETVEVTMPRLKALAHTDEMTGLFNRRHFDNQYSREWRRAARQRSHLSLLYVDIDHFKAYNDGFGHPRGDECLKRIAKALGTAIEREFDSICRIGGEEFAVIMPMTTPAGAIENAKRVLREVRHLALPHPLDNWPAVTVSLGVGTCLPAPEDNPSAFVDRVDAALYRAKQTGRDRFVCIPGMPVLFDVQDVQKDSAQR
ncbi:MAG: diguanylate cyclase [Pseudomonadota bacterium]